MIELRCVDVALTLRWIEVRWGEWVRGRERASEWLWCMVAENDHFVNVRSLLDRVLTTQFDWLEVSLAWNCIEYVFADQLSSAIIHHDGINRQTDRQMRKAERQTERQTVIFLKENPFGNVRKCWSFFRPKYRLTWCLIVIKVYHKPKLKREIVHISKFQNKILYQSKIKIPDIFSTSSKRLQDPKWKSRLCSTIFIISYQTLCTMYVPIKYTNSQYVQFA